MISKKMEEELNKQVNAEWYSAYIYKSMAAYFESLNLKGFSNWMSVQALEEMTHGEKIYNHIVERGGRVKLTSIQGPQIDWKSPLDAFEFTYKHEQHVTSLINALVDLAVMEKDHAANSMLQWFVDEQVEEEASADEIAQKLKLMKDAPGGLFMMDQELAKRVFVPPVQNE